VLTCAIPVVAPPTAELHGAGRAVQSPLGSGLIATGLVSINGVLTGFCIVGNILRLFGFTPMLRRSTPTPGNLYFMQTDRWYLERRIYLAVGINCSVASVLSGAQHVVPAVHRIRRRRNDGAMISFAATQWTSTVASKPVIQ
jgi:hypothetical protein